MSRKKAVAKRPVRKKAVKLTPVTFVLDENEGFQYMSPHEDTKLTKALGEKLKALNFENNEGFIYRYLETEDIDDEQGLDDELSNFEDEAKKQGLEVVFEEPEPEPEVIEEEVIEEEVEPEEDPDKVLKTLQELEDKANDGLKQCASGIEMLESLTEMFTGMLDHVAFLRDNPDADPNDFTDDGTIITEITVEDDEGAVVEDDDDGNWENGW